MNIYPELMLENWNVAEYFGLSTTCSPSTVEEMESNMFDGDETVVDDQEIKVVVAIEKISNEG